MPSEERSSKGPIISTAFMAAAMLYLPVSAMIDGITADSVDTSSHTQSAEEIYNAKGYDMLVDSGYNHVSLAISTPKNPLNIFEGITMTFNAAAPDSIDIGTKVVDCWPLDTRNPTSLSCSIQP